jgi:signal peptidase I
MKKALYFIIDIAKIVIIALAIVLPIRFFLFQPFFVKGESMEPNFKNGDYLIVDEISYRLRAPERGEVIVFKYPSDPSQLFIKRIIGLPGETVDIENNKINISKDEKAQDLDESSYLNSDINTWGSIKLTLGKDEYFVLGDNRLFSYDSRRFGILPKEDIIGRVVLRAWPIFSASAFKAPAYDN